MEMRKVLVGVDGGAAAAAALRWAAAAVRDSGGEVVAVHASDRVLVRQAADDAVNGLGMAASLRLWRERSGRALEEQWCEPLRQAGVRYRTVLVDGDPVHALLQTARKEDVDVIVIGHQGDSSLAHRLFRGLSDGLLDHARRPVVVVPYSKARTLSGSR
jgi:nucleotide-binding universal stress UspA family protein